MNQSRLKGISSKMLRAIWQKLVEKFGDPKKVFIRHIFSDRNLDLLFNKFGIDFPNVPWFSLPRMQVVRSLAPSHQGKSLGTDQALDNYLTDA